MTEFPPVAKLIPQAGPMLLLSRVLEHDATSTRCTVDVERGRLFRSTEGDLPAWLAIEFMAQCVAVHGALIRPEDEPPGVGLLVGSRRVTFRVDAFRAGASVEVSARYVASGGGLIAFDCAVEDGSAERPLVEGRLNVMPLREIPE